MMAGTRLPVPTRQTGMVSIDKLKASLTSSILRVLRALRGEFYSTSGLASQPASVPCEPKLDVATHSKQYTSCTQILLRSSNRSPPLVQIKSSTTISI